MPKYSQSNIEHIISEEEFAAMCNHARGNMARSWIIILWLTGARPGEVILLSKKDIIIEPDRTNFKLHTTKLGTTKQFVLRHRNLVLKIPSENKYISTLQDYLKHFRGDDSQLFVFGLKTGYNIVSNLSRNTLGLTLCPYNFRHTRMTLLAEHGASEEQLKQFKGSFTTQSVRPYLHIRKVEYTIEVEI